ncbi:MAG: maleate cis-trans isomerase [Chloroflexi bacterium]|nr:maleate cis-trans isomerase [Chloroflexota bacterium]
MTEPHVPVIGILYPGYAAEDDYPRAERMLGTSVSLPVVHTTVGIDTHEIHALIDTGSPERLEEGASRLAPLAPDAAMWACTSGSFVYGLEGARRQAAAVAEQLGVPVSSTSLAFAAALAELGLRRVAIGATYPEDLADRFRTFLADAGIEVVSMGTLGIMWASEGGTLSRQRVVDLALANRHPDAEAILLPDTALHTMEWLADLQDAAAVPVLTANQVTIWQGLRLAGHPAGDQDPFGAFGLA